MGHQFDAPRGEQSAPRAVHLQGGPLDGRVIHVGAAAVGLEVGDPPAAVYRIVRTDAGSWIGVLA